ncbi:MAG: FHA domain-containing protein [Planctomycetes bacterium]|nr:FHA domain-containing protein [Planctomycetota bacterium]
MSGTPGKKTKTRLVVTGILTDHLRSEKPYKLGRATTIGRGDDCRVKLYSTQVSRYHATIFFENQKFYLEDSSANGTLVNGEVVSRGRRELKNGDVIEIFGLSTNAKKLKTVFKATIAIQQERVSRSGLLTRLFRRKK